METTTTVATLFKVAAALMALLVLTIGLCFVDMGRFNMPVAIVIAVVKAVIVGAFFMELRFSSKATLITSMVGLFWLFLLVSGTLSDILTRLHVPAPF